ncbi:hypothetical protein ID866_4948 [Astraeus odoratus]|nr:hypothetical protein ID866_4948 [Astraeus odoratus]
MSAAIVLPPLSAWAASHISSLLESKTRSAFDAAFEGTFARNLDVVVNGKHISRDQYKELLLEQSGAAPEEAVAAVQIEGQTQVLGSQGQLSGFVGLFYSSISDSKFLVLGAPVESRTNSSINLTIEPTEKNPQPPTLPIRGFFDPRRVVAVNQVFAENTLQVSIPASSVPQEKASSSGKVELGPEPLNVPPKSTKFSPFGGRFGPGPVRIPGDSAGVVHIPRGESGATPETLPGHGEFGPGPVIIPGETIGEAVQRNA